MSLRPLNAFNPLGQFDVHDTEAASFLGGEVCTFMGVTTNPQPGVTGSGLDLGAYDVFDGYVSTSTPALTRPTVTKTFVAGTPRPLMLADEGILGYGTILGSVIGGTTGQGGAVAVGPSSLTGSGKITCWANAGIFAISLDAVDSTSGATALVPTNTALTVGAALGFTATGLLTMKSNGEGTQSVGNLIEFATNGSLVNTPNYLTQALNSPTGTTAAASARKFTYAVISWNPPTA